MSSREDIECRMTESNVADNVRWGQLLLNRLRYQKWIEIVQKGIDGFGILDHLRRVQFHLTKLGKLLLVDMILGPITLTAAMHVDGDAVLVSPHHTLNVVFFKRLGEVIVGVWTILEDPCASASKSIATVDNVPMLSEAAKHVLHALLQSVELWVNQNFSDEVIRGKLNQPLT